MNQTTEGGVPTVNFGLEIHDRLLSYLFCQAGCTALVSMCQQATHSKGTAIKMNWIRSAEPWTYPDIDRLYPQIMANYWNLCVFMSLWNPRNFWFCRLETSRSFFIVPSRGVGAYHWCTAHRKRGHPVSWWALFHFSDVSCLETWFQCFNAAVFSQFSVVWWCLQVLPKPPWNILGRVSRFILKPSQQCTKEPWPMAGLGLDRGGIPSFFFFWNAGMGDESNSR